MSDCPLGVRTLCSREFEYSYSCSRRNCTCSPPSPLYMHLSETATLGIHNECCSITSGTMHAQAPPTSSLDWLARPLKLTAPPSSLYIAPRPWSHHELSPLSPHLTRTDSRQTPPIEYRTQSLACFIYHLEPQRHPAHGTDKTPILPIHTPSCLPTSKLAWRGHATASSATLRTAAASQAERPSLIAIGKVSTDKQSRLECTSRAQAYLLGPRLLQVLSVEPPPGRDAISRVPQSLMLQSSLC